MSQERLLGELDANFAPYAPIKNVKDVITRRRERGLPDPLTHQMLQNIGVPEGNAPRTIQALRFLNLIDSDGHQTESMDRIARATSAEFQQVLGEIIRAAYHPVFMIVDPAQDGDVAIHDAFRQYIPQAQRDRMVTLFMGLCQEAGMVERQVRERRQPATRRSPAQTRSRPSPKPADLPENNKLAGDEIPSVDGQHTDYRLVSAVMQQLPANGKWTVDRREKWIQAVIASVDLIVEVTKEVEAN